MPRRPIRRASAERPTRSCRFTTPRAVDWAAMTSAGPGNGALLDDYTIPSDGTYYVAISDSYWSQARGDY